jgi:hypothetical protein
MHTEKRKKEKKQSSKKVMRTRVIVGSNLRVLGCFKVLISILFDLASSLKEIGLI